MATGEAARHDLYRGLEEVLGTDRAVTLMEHLPPLTPAERATKRDLAELEGRMELRFDAMDHKLEAMEHRLTAAFRGELNAAITAQTRAIVFTMAGTIATVSGLALAIARFAPGA